MAKQPTMREQAKASTALTPATDKPVVALQIVVEGAGEWKAGDHITTERHLGEYYKSYAADDRLADVTTEQIVAVVKPIVAYVKGDDDKDTTEIDWATTTVNRLAAIMEAPFVLRSAASVPNAAARAQLETGAGQELVVARMLGDAIDKDTDAGLSKAIEATKDANAGPVLLAYNFARLLKDLKDKEGNPLVNSLPPIGSRFQGGKSDRAPYGYCLPSEKDKIEAGVLVWNGPWDHYAVPNLSGVGPDTIKHSFVADVVTRHWPHYADYLDHIRAVIAGKPLADCPANLQEIAGDAGKLQAELDETAFQFNRRVNMATKALKLLQRMREYREHFDGITIGLYGKLAFGETNEVAARRLKPFAYVSKGKYVDDDTGEERDRDIVSPPIPMSKVLNTEPRSFPKTATVATLTAKKQRGTKPGAEGKTGTEPGSRIPRITDVFALREYMDEVAVYLDNTESFRMLKRMLDDKKHGDEFCYDVAAIHTYTSQLITPDVTRRADEFAARQREIEKAKQNAGEKKEGDTPVKGANQA